MQEIAVAKINTSKVTVEDVAKFNLELVDRQDSDACRLRKLVRHERLYNIMKDGPISKDKTIWFYLDHYGSDRLREIDRLKEKLNDEDFLEGPKSSSYDVEFLKKYFADDV